MKRWIHSSSKFYGGSKDEEDEIREGMFKPNNYADLDPERIEDALNIDWGDVVAEDSEMILEDTETFPDLSTIISMRYFDDGEQEWADRNNYDGGYVAKYSNGREKGYAWRLVDDTIDEIEIA